MAQGFSGITPRNTLPRHLQQGFLSNCPDAFLECYVQWVQGICPALQGEVVAIEGKALCHAAMKAKPFRILSAHGQQKMDRLGGQVKVDDKSNEITAIPELLRALEIKGCMVTLDAMRISIDCSHSFRRMTPPVPVGPGPFLKSSVRDA